MPCSSTYLFIDMSIWLSERVSSMLVASYQNLSEGDKYDCALSSAPCESNITKALISLDPDQVYWSDIVLVYILLTSVFFLGLFGNICNIIILSTNNIASDSTNNLLLATSCSDLLYSLSVGVNLIHSYLCLFDIASAISAYNATSFDNYFVSKLSGLLSLDFITVMSIQRAVAVVFPFKISQIFSYRNTYVVIAFLVVSFFAAVLPLLATTIPRLIYHPFFGKPIFLGYNFGLDYSSVVVGVYQPYYMSRTIIDLMLLLISLSLTIHNLRQHVKTRSSLKASNTSGDDAGNNKTAMSDREVKVIKLSVVVCYVSFVVYCVECASSILLMSVRNNMFTSINTIILTFFAKFSGAMGCSFNFILYMSMSVQFRESFLKMFVSRGDLKK